MRTIALWIVLSVSVLSTSAQLESGWKGIKVFETSRENVDKLLGKPVSEERGLIRYETYEARYQFVFSGEPCSGLDTIMGGFNVPKNRVLEYTVHPKRQLKLENLEWDRGAYKRTLDDHLIGIIHYGNVAEGIHLSADSMEGGKYESIRSVYFNRSPAKLEKHECKVKYQTH